MRRRRGSTGRAAPAPAPDTAPDDGAVPVPCGCLDPEGPAGPRATPAADGLTRRRALQAAVGAGAAAAVWGAPRIERLTIAPDYAAAATNLCLDPGLVRLLGWTDKTSLGLPNDEYRADFIIRVPRTATIGTITYRWYTATTAGGDLTAVQLPSSNVSDVGQHYRIVARTTVGGCDLVAISLMGDMSNNDANERRALRISVPYGAVAPNPAGTITFGQATTTATGVPLPGAPNGFDTQVYRTSPTDGSSGPISPIMRLPWDYLWTGYPAGMSSQTGWGRIVPASGLSGAVFTIHPRNPSTVTCNAPSTTILPATSATVKYQWAKETAPGVFTLVGTVQTYTGDNGDTLVWNGTTGPSFLRISQDFSAPGYGAGYYKLLCWPEMQSRLGEDCSTRYTPYDATNPNSAANLAAAWTVGTAFYGFVPS